VGNVKERKKEYRETKKNKGWNEKKQRMKGKQKKCKNHQFDFGIDQEQTNHMLRNYKPH